MQRECVFGQGAAINRGDRSGNRLEGTHVKAKSWNAKRIHVLVHDLVSGGLRIDERSLSDSLMRV